MDKSLENKVISQAAVTAFGGESKIKRYWDDLHESSIDILTCENSPMKGIDSFSTSGLSQHSIKYFIGDIPLRVEIVGACYTGAKCFENILASCAFSIINFKYTCSPGTIFEDIIEQYIPKSNMKHVMFVSPFLWDNKLETLSFSDKKVAWLMVVPISHNELQFAREHGSSALEEIFVERNINIFDFTRASVI